MSRTKSLSPAMPLFCRRGDGANTTSYRQYRLSMTGPVGRAGSWLKVQVPAEYIRVCTSKQNLETSILLADAENQMMQFPRPW
jgi:hypothetical protein